MFALPEFCKPPLRQVKYDFLSPSSLFLANARSSITILANILQSKTVWMPSYFCPVMLQALKRQGVEIQFFPVDLHLRIEITDWISRINKNDLVILIDYFGFPTELSIAEKIKARQAWILEDASQAMLTYERLPLADFLIISPRKFTGVPDGGVLVSKCSIKFDEIALEDAPLEWQVDSLRASVLRKGFDRGLTQDRMWYTLFRKQEEDIPIGYFSMSDISRYLLENIIDYTEIAGKRRENYLFLLERLKPWAMYKTLNDSVVPLGFPIVLENRDAIRQKLFAECIYPPVHWEIKDAVPSVFEHSHWLSAHIMTLPCDQRYNFEDMERLCILFQKLAERPA